MECDRLYHNNQDVNAQELCTFDQGSSGKYFETCLINPKFFLAFLIFSLMCLNVRRESSIRPRCFCSLTFLTIVPLKIN